MNKDDVCYDSTLDIVINLYEEIINRVIFYDDVWYRDESGKISQEMKEGLKTPNGVLENQNDYNDFERGNVELY